MSTADTATADAALEEHGEVELVFHASRIAEVAHAFQRMIRRGEERLHRLARLLSDTLYEGRHDLRSVVVGEVATRIWLILNSSSTN